MALKTPHVVTPTDADRDPLDLIAEEFAELCRRGKTPSISEFVNRYPNHAEDLEELLPAVGQMESLKRLRKATTCDPHPLIETLPERVGDYRILREIGRGGMGIVYEAEQTSLGRKVALKILPIGSRTEAGKRERFLREAQAAARLHHTNIVPVFGVGEDNGVPYYVMQYIRGCGLDDIIHGWRNDVEVAVKPREWRTIARLIATAAETLDYAHTENILHRDVKPGNLLLDAAGHLWVTDFGLAKMLDEATHTATGHVLGTFQYMAPEALKGQSDPRTDVYGLGMTLYELLTGCLPYDETNPAVLVRLIGEHEPPSPRSIDLKIPRNLETICLKAISREPSRRYQSAAEFAEDLRAYLIGRPISARRLSSIDRSLLWCRRNPVVGGLSAAIVLTLAVSTVFGWSQYAKAKRALTSESIALSKEKEALANEEGLRALEKQRRLEAEQAKKLYQENLDLSLLTLEKILDIAARSETIIGPGPAGTGPDGPRGPRPGEPGFGPPDGPGLRPVPERAEARNKMLTGNVQMLAEILAFYENFAAKIESTPKMKLDAARAYRRVGEVYFALGSPEKGEAAIRKAVQMLEELRIVFEDPQRIRDELNRIREDAERRRIRRLPKLP